MALAWTGWVADPNAGRRTPYVDWYLETDLRGAPLGAGIEIRSIPLPGRGQSLHVPPVARIAAGRTGKPIAEDHLAGYEAAEVPLPGFAWPPAGTPITPAPVAGVAPPPVDAVVVGIIDTALAPGHERFRFGGGSRFLASWQQGAAWSGQTWLPFGREVRQNEIDAAIARNGDDQDGIDAALGLTKFDHPRGDRSLARRVSHGTHVLDLATGFDPARPDPKAARLPILGVTLPTGLTVGASGSFLEFFVLHAIDWIVARADAFWQAAHGPAHAKGARGWPIVINLSYALAAGPKDGTSRIESFVSALVAWRRANRLSPLRVVMPAGNDNLMRGHATFDFGTVGDMRALDWRIQPEDRSSSHVEIWSDVKPGAGAKARLHPFAVALAPPGGPACGLSQGRDGQMRSLVDSASGKAVARIYCRKADDALVAGKAGRHRFVHVLCVAPTWGATPLGPTGLRWPEAPAGAWRITLKRRQKIGRAILFVQTDQSLTLTPGPGRLSYFDHPAYRRHDEDGRRIDSYSYPSGGAAPADQDRPGPVRRHNTLNALATSAGIVTVAGHRGSDGRPADYAGTGRGFSRGGGASGPIVSLPSDDGFALEGLIGAGSRSGSALALQGTSMATALATRRIAQALLGWHASGASARTVTGSPAWIARLAAAAEASAGHPGRIAAPKSGAGRLAAPDIARIPRRA